jgi:hypothetical protein
MGERRGEYMVLVGKPEGKRLMGRPRRRVEDILRWQWFGGMDWINLAQDKDRWRALISEVMNMWYP